MTFLRIYNAGDGDCIRIEDAGKTLLVFDTGRDGSYRTAFRKALDESSDPPVVVISHVDADHIGGLRMWVKDVLGRSRTWIEAGRLARREVKEVWCNVPTQLRALASFARLSVFQREPDLQGVQGEHQGQLPSWDGLLPGGRPLGSDSDDEHPSQVLSALEARQTVIRHLLDTSDNAVDAHRADIDGALARLAERGSFDLYDWLSRAFPDQGELLTDLFRADRGDRRLGSWCSVSIPIEIRLDGQGRQGRDDRHMVMWIETWLEVECGGAMPSVEATLTIHVWSRLMRSVAGWSYDRYWRTEGRWPEHQDSRRFEHVLSPFTCGRANTARTARTVVRVTIEVGSASAGDVQYEEGAKRLRGRLEGCDSALDAVAFCLSFAESLGDLDDRTREKLAILRIVFGVAPLEATEENLSLFKALDLLGIRVRGRSVGDSLGAGVSIGPSYGLNGVFLSPTVSELQALQRKWDSIQGRLQVRPPETFRDCMMLSMAYADATPWRPDTSVTNLSSIALWLRQVGEKSSVFLTGDSMHSNVMEQLRREAGEPHAEANRRQHHYQIPHHGGSRNTDVTGDDRPSDLLHPGRPIATAFASGGVLEVQRKRENERPCPAVLNFHRAAAADVLRTRQQISSGPQSYVDIPLS